MVIIYRAYPGISKDPVNNGMPKLNSVLTNLNSIKEASSGLHVAFEVILDNCSPEYRVQIEHLLEGFKVNFYEVNFKSNSRTFELQLQLVEQYDKLQNCLIIEDDYIMNRECLTDLCACLHKIPNSFFTPFYSRDYDTLEFHNYEMELIKIDNKMWRSVNSTTLTFCAKAETIQRYRSNFNTFSLGNNDSSIWMSITKKTNFWNTILGTDRWYFLKKYLKIIRFSFWDCITKEKTSLFAQVESTATHLESTNCALNTNELIKQNKIVHPVMLSD